MRAALRLAAPFALAGAVLGLTACESNVERSARLERARLAHRASLKASAVSISKPNPRVRVLAGMILQGREGDAVVVTLRNRSAAAESGLPIEIAVRDAAGKALYRNDTPGAAGSLVTVPSLGGHASAVWIDDQVSVAGRPARVRVLVGAGRPTSGQPPQMKVTGVHPIEGGEGVSGQVANPTALPQRELVVNAVARRSGRIVAAGRAVLPELGAHASSTFQLYLIGDPRGASLQVEAPASALR